MRVAILGLGIVGRGVYELLIKETHIEVAYIVEIDDAKLQGLKHLKAPSFEHVLKDRSVDTIIEVIGGKTIAYDMVKRAIEANKHVVTANKALISASFKELHELASKHHVYLKYEASVAGATLVVKPLMRMSYLNHFYKLEGILNGTTNYVLTQIFKHKKDLSQALKDAEALGFIEAGSNDDMLGLDTMRKINIMSMHLYHTYIEEKDIQVIPLTILSETLIDHLKALNYIIKYMALSHVENNHLTIQVMPIAYQKPSIYDHIDDEMNILFAYGKYHQKQAFIGQGAGRYPTATAIISDLDDINTHVRDELQFEDTYRVNKKQYQHTFIIETQDGFEMTSGYLDEIITSQNIKSWIKVEDAS